MLQVESYCSLCTPTSHLLIQSQHISARSQDSFTVSIKRGNSPQSHGQILTMLMSPLLLGSSPPFNWIKCNMNCTLRCDDKASLIGFNLNVLGYLKQFKSQPLITQLILIEMDWKVPKWKYLLTGAEEQKRPTIRNSKVFYYFNQS